MMKMLISFDRLDAMTKTTRKRMMGKERKKKNRKIRNNKVVLVAAVGEKILMMVIQPLSQAGKSFRPRRWKGLTEDR